VLCKKRRQMQEYSSEIVKKYQNETDEMLIERLAASGISMASDKD